MEDNEIAQEKSNKTIDSFKRNKDKAGVGISIVYVLSYVFLLVALLYIFAYYHYDDKNTNILFFFLPSIKSFMILPIPFFTDWARNFIYDGGVFGFQLLGIAFMLRLFCIKKEYGMFIKIIKGILIAMIILVILDHFFLQYYYGFSFFDNLFTLFKIGIVYILIGLIIFAIIKLIFRKRGKENA